MTRLLTLAFVVSVAGVTPSASAQSTPAQPLSPEQGTVAPKPDPQRHLSDAQRKLDALATTSLGDDGNKKLSQLRDDVKKLMATYGSHAEPSAASGSGGQDSSDWSRKFSDVERDLVAILGGGSSLNTTSTTAVGTASGGNFPGQTAVTNSTSPAPTGANAAASQGNVTAVPPASANPTTAGAAPASSAAPNANNGVVSGASSSAGGAGSPSTTSGTTAGSGGATATNGADANGIGVAGVAVKEIGVKNLDPRVRVELEQVRTSIELFYDATTRILVR